GRGHAGIGPDRTELHSLAGSAAQNRSRGVRAPGYSRSPAGRRDSERGAVGGDYTGNGDGVGFYPAQGAPGRRHDRRDHAARAGAAGGRDSGEAPDRASRRREERDAAQAQRERPRGNTEEDAARLKHRAGIAYG